MGTLDTLWRMLGIANQLLAAIALAVGTTYLLLHAPKRRYALCTGIPFVFVLFTVVTAGVMSIHGWWVARYSRGAAGKSVSAEAALLPGVGDAGLDDLDHRRRGAALDLDTFRPCAITRGESPQKIDLAASIAARRHRN